MILIMIIMLQALWSGHYVISEKPIYQKIGTIIILAHNRHLRRSATKLRTAQQILILQDNAALQSNYNVFYVHRYAFYDQFAIKWCLIRCYRYNWSEVIGVERSWEAKSLVPPTVHWCSFKATINWLIWNDVELVRLQNCYLGFSKFWKFRKFSKKGPIFFLFVSVSPQIKIFKKP